MIKDLLLICLLSFSIQAYTQTADEWFQKGEQAWDNEEYVDAKWYYQKAADLGSEEACGSLAYLYFYAALTGKRDTENAYLWARKVDEGKNDDCNIVLGLIAYYSGDFDKAKRLFSLCKNEINSEAKIALAISYMMNGSKPIRFLGKQKAEPLLKEVYNQWRKEDEKPWYFYSASAILAKIEFEKKWKWNNNVIKYLSEFGKFGAENRVYCPLAQFVLGRGWKTISDKQAKSIGGDIGVLARYTPDFGKKLVKVAAQYEYTDSKFEILFPFAEEIQELANKIK